MDRMAEANLNRRLERLIDHYRRYYIPSKTPLELVLQLSSHLPDSIKIQQIVLKNPDQSSDSDDESLLYITKILIENKFPFESIDESKTKSVEKAAAQVITFLTDCTAIQNENILFQLMAMQSMAWMDRGSRFYEYDEEDFEDYDSRQFASRSIPRIEDKKVTRNTDLEGEIIENWIELLKLFKAASSTNKNELEILDEIDSSEKNILTIKTESSVPSLKMFSTKIQITGSPISEFTAKSPFGAEDSKWEAAIKFIGFLNKLCKLLSNFKFAYQPDREPFKLVVGLIHQNSDIIKMVKSGTDFVRRNPKYSAKIEIVNVVTVEESGERCGDVAAEKIVDILKKLTGINEVAQKTLKTTSKPNLLEESNPLIETIEIFENAGLSKNKTKIKPMENKKSETIMDNSKPPTSNDDSVKGIKKKLENMKELQFKKKLVKFFNLANAQKKSPLDLLDFLISKGINLEISQTSKKSHFQTRIKFRGFTGGSLPEFYDNSRKKLDSKRAAATKLVAYLKKLAKEDKEKEEVLNETKAENEPDMSRIEDNETNEKKENLEKLIERFKSLNVLKQSQLEILDMLKSKGESIEIEHSLKNEDHLTIIKMAGIEFTSTAPKKADSKRNAANKVVDFLKALAKNHHEPKNLSDESSESEESANQDSECEEEPMIKLKANIVQPVVISRDFSPKPASVQNSFPKSRSSSTTDSEPLWGHYEGKNPFILNQRKQQFSAPKNKMTTEELEPLHFGHERNQEVQDGPNEAKIQELIMLIKRFDSVNSKIKGKLQVINDLKEKGQSLKIYRTVMKNEADGSLIFHVSINIVGIAYFEQNSADKKYSEAAALNKTMRFLKNVSHLVKNFLYFYSRSKYPTEIIESLMIKNFEMLIIIEDARQSDGQYKMTIKVTNIGLYTGVDREAIQAKEIAMTKVCYLILKLAGIHNGSLKVKDYVALKPWAMEAKKIPMKKTIIAQKWSDSDADEEEDDDDQNGHPTYSEIFKKNLVQAEPESKPESKVQNNTTKSPNEPNSFERMIKLIGNFKSAPNLESNSLEAQWSILEHLRAQGEQICIISDIIGPVDAREYSMTIEIKDVATFTAQATSELKCKEDAVKKTIGFLKKNILQNGNDQQNGRFQNEFKIETPEINFEKYKFGNTESDKVEIPKKQNLFELLLNFFKNVYKSTSNPTQILDTLIVLISATPNCTAMIQLNQINSRNGQCITTINLGGDGYDFMEVFYGTGAEQEESKAQAAIKMVHYLTGHLERQLEQQLDLKLLVKDSNLLLDSDISKAVYEAVKIKWTQLSNVNPIAQFKAIAAFVVTSEVDPKLAKVLSIGTGTQSIESKDALPYNGQVILDCHAEIIARRGLLCYLYDQIDQLIENQTNEDLILELGTTGFRLKRNLKLHLYLNSTPCSVKEAKFSLFKSCVDKIKCWNALGVQGAVLGSFMEPLYLDSVVITDLTRFDKLSSLLYDGLDLSLLQAMLESMELNSSFKLNRHKIGYYRPLDSEKFQASSIQEYPISHNWYRPTSPVLFHPLELLHAQLGTLLAEATQSSRLSKQAFVLRYQELTQKYPGLLELNKRRNSEETSVAVDPFAPYYRGLKNRSINYQKAKKAVKDTFTESTGLNEWIQTPIHVDLFMI